MFWFGFLGHLIVVDSFVAYFLVVKVGSYISFHKKVATSKNTIKVVTYC